MSIVLRGIDPRLDEILKPTYYQLIFQEQVTEIVMTLAGYDAGKADVIRKTIGRKIASELDALIPDLIKSFMEYGKIPEDKAVSIADCIQACSSYLFNKCLAGSERIMRNNNTKPYTIEEMYKIRLSKEYAEQIASKSLRDKYKREGFGKSYSFDDEINAALPNNIIDIQFAGIREVYKVTLANGATVRCTMNHKFPTPDGEKMLADLKLGDKLYVIEKDKPLNYGYLIGEGTNLPVKGQRGFQVKKEAVSQIYENYRNECKEMQKPCEICGKSYDGSRFELHHKDLNRANSNMNNLAWLCVSCHKKEHYRMGRHGVGQARRHFLPVEIISVEPDGVENTFSVEMLSPFHTFTLSSGILSSNSHSVEYGLIAYQTAYLKANYPVEYMCSLLNANIDTTEDALPYINECKRMGIKILPPDVSVGNVRFIPEGNAIRIGLSYIKGINNIKVHYCNSVNEFFYKNGYNKRIKEALIKAGAMDCFGISRNKLLVMALNLDKEKEAEEAKIIKAKQKIAEKQAEISASKQGTKKVALLYKQIENQKNAITKSEAKVAELDDAINNDFDEAQGEIDTLGFTFKDKFARYVSDDLDIYSPQKIITQVVLADVVNVRNIKDRKKKDMAFITAIPHNGVKQEFVMFASNYVKIDTGMYVLKVRNCNQIVDVMKAKKKAA